jgi:probable F420-dependent oxidoreductase
VAETATAADERGFDSVWVSDHVVMPSTADASSHGLDPRTSFLEPFTTLAFVAARTNRVQLGTGVYVLPLRHPLVAAKEASTLAVLSKGRLLLGVGVGWLREEFELLGTPWTGRGRRTDAAIDLMRRCWTATGSEIEMWPKPARSIPVIMGGKSSAALDRTIRLGDGWYGSGISADRFGELADQLTSRMQAAGAEGRLLLGTRAADVAPDDARKTIEAFGRAGADFVVLDAVRPCTESVVDWVHHTADDLGLDASTTTPLVSARTWS